MMKKLFSLIFLLLLTSTSLAEVIDIGNGYKINIPEGMTYTKKNALEIVRENFERRKLSKKEIKDMMFLLKKAGFDGTEDEIDIMSQEEFDYIERDKDEFGKAENDLIFLEVAQKCKDKKTDKSFKNCLSRELKIALNSEVGYTINMSNTVSQQMVRLNSLSLEELNKLSKKEYKKINKEHSSKIKFKSKSGKFSEKGTRKIRVTNDGNFYIVQKSTIIDNDFKYSLISFVISVDNRSLHVSATCFGESCKGVGSKMIEIIEPTFKIETQNITTYDIDNKEEMLMLVGKVRNGYKIFKIAKLLLILL